MIIKNKKKILISAPYMLREKEKAEKLFLPYPVITCWADVKERLNEKDLLSIIGKYEGILCGDDRITASVIDKALDLKVIVKWGTGIDSIDVAYAKKKGIPVFNTPNAFSTPVSDTTLAMILSFVRRLNDNNMVLKGGGWDKPQGFSLSEKVVGIIGCGNVGLAVAKRLYGFDTVILANDIKKIDEAKVEKYGINLVTKEEIYKRSDFISIHCDLNKTTYHLLNREAFIQMEKKPFIINTARGPIIDEAELVFALNTGMIKGAGLDVYEEEPLPVLSPLRKMDTVILSAHNSNSSPCYWQKVHENSVRMMMKGLGL